MAYTLIAWLDSLIPFPSDFQFIKFIVLGVVLIIGVSLSYSFIVQCFSGIFNRR